MSITNEIFFSYAWGDENEQGESREKVVDDLYQSLIDDGYKIVRDKNDLGYKGFISDFMRGIGEGKNIVIAISRKYVKSPYCMFELYEIARNSNFDKYKFSEKVLPIIVEPIGLNNPAILEEYFSYWEAEFNKWDKLVKKRSGELSIEQLQRYDKIKMVYQNFGKLAEWLTDMNTLNPAMLSRNNFDEIKKAIESKSNALPSSKNYLQELENGDFKITSKKSGFLKIAIGIVIIITAILLVYFFPRYSSNSNLPQTQSVSVFVHGKKGKQDMILRKQGYVIMDVKGGERKKADINENGVAYFQNIHIGDSVRVEVDFSEPYKSTCPDSIFLINPEGRIYLPVALQGLNQVAGRVIYNDAPLEGVVVSIDMLADTTDQNGRYQINIPETEQKQRYDVWFNKKGFKVKSAPAYPQTGEDLNIIMEK